MIFYFAFVVPIGLFFLQELLRVKVVINFFIKTPDGLFSIYGFLLTTFFFNF